MSIDQAISAILEAADWSAVVAALDAFDAHEVQAVAEGLWDRAWYLLEEGETAAARQVTLLGELVDRVGLVGPDATVEAFLDLGAIDVGLDEVQRLAQKGGPHWFAARYDAGVLHAHRFALTGEVTDLDAAVEALVDAAGTPDAADRADAAEVLASVWWQRFTATSEGASLDRGLAAVADADTALAHNIRGNLLKERYDWYGDVVDLDAAIAAYEQAVALAEPGSEDDAGFRGNLAMAYADRYLRTGSDADLVAADVDAEASVGPHLALRAEELNRPEDAEAVQSRIEMLMRAVTEQHPYAPERFVDLGQLGSALHIRWRDTGDAADLKRARRYHQRALMATSPDSIAFPVRAYALADSALSAGAGEDAIRWATVALQVIPEHGPLRPAAASMLGAAYNDRYDNTGDVDDLTTAIDHLSAAVAECPRGSRELPSFANNLGNALRRRFHRARDIADLDEAIEQLQHALDATEPDSINYPGLLRNLAAALTDAQQAVRAEGGTTTDFADDAISAANTALDSLVPQHPDRPDVQEILAAAHLQRALTTGARTDFDTAVTVARGALSDPDHGAALASSLAERFDRFGDAADCVQAEHQYRMLATDPRRSPEQALRNARNWGGWAADHGDWELAVEAFEIATARAEVLHQTQRRELGTAEWLEYTRGLPHWAALAHHRTGAPAEAVTAFERGRAVLLRASLSPAQNASDHPVPAHVVHLVSTRLGGVALITAPNGSVTGLDLPQLTEPDLIREVNALIAAHDHRREQPARWNKAVVELTAWAWDAAMGPILDALPPNPRIVLVPGAGGALIPWHAAWPAGADADDPHPAATHATISYAAHRQALAAAHDLARRAGRPRHLLSIIDPRHTATAPLPEAAAEAAFLGQRFAAHSSLAGAAATRSAVLEQLRGNDAAGPVDTLLAACHADADLAEPTNSALLLAGDDTLTVEQIQRLGSATTPLRLALLTACRTAQPGAYLPDETISLPTALLRAGCAASVGTLWAVPAQTAALFTALFASHWLDRELDPAAATRATVEQLRTIDYAAERAALGGSAPTRGIPRRFRSHAHPARWAAFICSGW